MNKNEEEEFEDPLEAVEREIKQAINWPIY